MFQPTNGVIIRLDDDPIGGVKHEVMMTPLVG
jgi:hypothetical protein